MKKCKLCGTYREITDFYVHKQMKDGHLNICKKCKLEYAKKYCLSERGKIVDKRREKKLNRKQWKRKKFLEWVLKNPEKRKAQVIFLNKIRYIDITKEKYCRVCNCTNNINAHHYDYSKPLSVIFLCSKHHKDVHNSIIQIKKEWIFNI